MNSIDSMLDRLLRAASRCPDESPAEAPFSLEARVLGQWRASRAAKDPLASLAWFRRGFALACAITVVIATISVTRITQSTTNFWTVPATVVNLAAVL